MPRALNRSDTTTLSEFVEGVMFFPIAFVVCSTTAPGFLLCIPVITLATLFVAIPIVAVALVVLAAVAVVTTPVVLYRLARATAARIAAAFPGPRVAPDRTPELDRRPLTELAPR